MNLPRALKSVVKYESHNKIEGMQKEAMTLLDGVLPEGVIKKENNTKLTPNHDYVNY
jgi:hypothetical protein